MTSFKFSHPVPVRFADLDPLGHVNHIAYLEILEVGRIAYYYQVMGLRSIQEIKFVLAELKIRYLAPALLGQTLRVHLRTVWLKRSSSGFAFQMRNAETDELLAEGEGVQVYQNLAAHRPEPLPAAYRERVLAFEGDSIAAV